MSRAEVDAYFATLEEVKRTTLEEMRRRILEVIPDAEETISYGCPAFKVQGKVIAGLAAFQHHLSYLPHSGSVFPHLAAQLEGYRYSSGALRSAVDDALPAELVSALIELRLAEALPERRAGEG